MTEQGRARTPAHASFFHTILKGTNMTDDDQQNYQPTDDAAIRAAKLILIADGFCELMAKNDFDLDALPVESLEKLRNMCSAIESAARREMARRCLEVLDILNHGWGN